MEVEHYREKGWVHLPAFFSRDWADDLYAWIKARETTGKAGRFDYVKAGDPFEYREGEALSAHSPATLILSKDLGANMARLLEVSAIRLIKDTWLIKQPKSRNGHGETFYHQDFPGSGLDRSMQLNLWISPIDQPAESGLMRFRSGSHRTGVLGRNAIDKMDFHEHYPFLNELELSPPFAMAAGDATAHACLTVHGAPPNTTDKPRYGYVVTYSDAHALYTGISSPNFESVSGLEAYKTPDHPSFPVIYQND